MPDAHDQLAAIADLQKRYVYTRDQADRWTLLTAPEGPLAGDCEDYAYSIAWLVAGRSWRRFWAMIWRREIELWWTKFHGTGEAHVMVWIKGLGWSDSYYQRWSDAPRHPALRRYGLLRLARTLLLK